MSAFVATVVPWENSVTFSRLTFAADTPLDDRLHRIARRGWDLRHVDVGRVLVQDEDVCERAPYVYGHSIVRHSPSPSLGGEAASDAEEAAQLILHHCAGRASEHLRKPSVGGPAPGAGAVSSYSSDSARAAARTRAQRDSGGEALQVDAPSRPMCGSARPRAQALRSAPEGRPRRRRLHAHGSA